VPKKRKKEKDAYDVLAEIELKATKAWIKKYKTPRGDFYI